MFNLLTDKAPQSVVIDGREYPINWAFQYHIKIINMLHDPDLSAEDKRALSLYLFYPKVPENIEAAAEKMDAFYISDKPKNQYQKSAEKRACDSPAFFSYEFDDEYIYAAFRQQYGINLQTVSGLHWYEFRALLSSLRDCMFSDILQYRGMNTETIKHTQTRQYYADLKYRWALPLSQNVQDATDELEAILLGDGDLTKLRGG